MYLIYIDDSVGGRFTLPNRMIKVAFDPIENDFEDGEAAAKTFSCEEIPFTCDLALLGVSQLVNIADNLESSILDFQTFLFLLRFFALFAVRPR